jgi:chromosomal replication initiation ATPase DnaA
MIERATYQKLDRELNVVFVPRGTRMAGGRPVHEATDEDVAGSPRHPVGLVGNLNRWFTFERYVPAEGNRMALSCCQDILSESGFRMTPVVVYGRPGLGKTHLLHAMAKAAAGNGWPVACLSAEEFTSRFTNALRNRAIEEFQSTLRSARLLLIDDLQDFAGRKATQEEFVHSIDAVLHAGGCVVVASEEHPMELNLPERLASRLSAGVAARILPFMAEERRQYVELLGREHSVALPSWAVDRIVGIEAPSVRVLQGAVNGAITLQRCGMLDLARLDTELTRIARSEVTHWRFLTAIARHGRPLRLCFDDFRGLSAQARRHPCLGGRRGGTPGARQELSQIARSLAAATRHRPRARRTW